MANASSSRRPLPGNLSIPAATLLAVLCTAPAAAEAVIQNSADHAARNAQAERTPVALRGGGGGVSGACLPGALQARLSQVRARFGAIQVISAHRSGAKIAGTSRPSMHSSCQAVDFRFVSGNTCAKRREAFRWLREVHDGGVGLYCTGSHSHIHIDTGDRRSWQK